MKVTAKVSDAGSVAQPRLQHVLGFHSSHTHLLRQLVALAEAAVHRGEPVAVALAPATTAALRSALSTTTTGTTATGTTATGTTATGTTPILLDLATPGDGSGQTTAVVLARRLRELTHAGRVTLLCEHQAEFDGPDGSFWTELDAAVNVALADLPVEITCFYPEMPLHLSVLDGARCNHPHLLVDGELRHNPDHRPPREVLARHPVASPMLLGAPDLHIRFQAWQLQDVRRTVRKAAADSGFDDDRIDDIVLAVNEVATNAVEHGGPDAEMSIWAGPAALVCEVHDRGRLTEPLPGLLAPHPSEPRGRGMWIARQVCDLLHVWTDSDGTHVRIRAAP